MYAGIKKKKPNRDSDSDIEDFTLNPHPLPHGKQTEQNERPDQHPGVDFARITCRDNYDAADIVDYSQRGEEYLQ